MPLAEVANSMNIDQGPSSGERLRGSAHESLTESVGNGNPSKDMQGEKDTSHVKVSSPPTPRKESTASDRGVVDGDENHNHGESKEISNTHPKKESRDETEKNIASGRRVSLSSSSLTATMEEAKQPEDANDAIASIAAAAAIAGKATDDTLEHAVVKDSTVDSQHSEKEKEQSESKPKSPPKEEAIHTRDIKMTKDDALLGDVPWTL